MKPALWTLAFWLSLTATLDASKPNVVFLLVDDQGYYDLGCYGATEFKTPRIEYNDAFFYHGAMITFVG